MKYQFITNFKEERLKYIYIAIKANEIKDYCFCKTAKSKQGEVLPGYYALYFGKNVTEKEIELFYRALHFINLHVKDPNSREYTKKQGD